MSYVKENSCPGTVPTKKYNRRKGRQGYRQGCHGKQGYTSIARPYKASGKKKTKSMKEIYAELPRFESRPKTAERKLRRKLTEIKMPMHVSRTRNENPKKMRSARRIALSRNEWRN